MNIDALIPTFASLLFAALSLLFIFLLPVNWQAVRARAGRYLRRRAKYMRVKWRQASRQDKQVIGVTVGFIVAYGLMFFRMVR